MPTKVSAEWHILPKYKNLTTKTNYLTPFPIRAINFSEPAEKAKHGQMVTLVKRMLALHKNLASAKTPQEKESMQRQVESTDGGIDKLVYELYGLTDEEMKIVES